MTHEQAMRILRDQIVTLSGLDDSQVRRGPTDAPGPDESVIIMTPLSDLGIGRPSRRTTSLKHARESDVLLSAYGQAAVDALYLVAMELWADTPDGMSALALGVTLRAVSPVGFVPQVVRTANEPRSSTTVRIGYIMTRTVVEPASAESIVVSLEPNDLDPLTITTEVDP